MTLCRLIVRIFWCILLCIGTASCNMFGGEEGVDSYDSENSNPVGGAESYSGNGIKDARDSVYVSKDDYEKLSSKVLELDNKIIEISESIQYIEESVRTQKNEGVWSILIGWGLGIIGIVAAVASLLKISSLKREILNLQANSTQRNGQENTQQVSYVEFSRLERRVNELELKASHNSQMEPVQYHREPCCKQEQRDVIQRRGYFGSPIEGEEGHGYFKRLLESLDGARFDVTVEGNNAEFSPIVQPGELASSDAMDLAIEYEGEVNKSDIPQDMQVRQKGLAVKKVDKWIIINKAIVILKK